MADNKQTGIFRLTHPVTIDYPHLLEAAPVVQGGPPKFSINLIIPADHPDLAEIKATAIKVAKEKWPGRELKELQLPFSSGTKLADDNITKRKAQNKEPNREYVRGKAVIAARSKYQPALAGLENGKPVDYTDDAAKAQAAQKFFFPGAEVLAEINFSAYKGIGKNPDGVCAYINSVFGTGRGTRLAGGQRSAAATFAGYAGSATEVDPTAGAEESGSGIPDTW